MAKEESEQERRSSDDADPMGDPLEMPADRHEDVAPDLAVEPEAPAEDEEDVRRMWEASDPLEGEAPTG